MCVCMCAASVVDDPSVRGLAASLRERWDLDYLRSAHPRTAVEVSASEHGVLDGTLEVHETLTMRLDSFLGQILQASPGAPWRRRPSALRLHLAQCPLSLLPRLAADAPPPRWVVDAAAATGSRPAAHLWVCVGGGRSSMHYDCADGTPAARAIVSGLDELS